MAIAFHRPSDEAPLALLYLDLDGFKPINDRLGHDAGDELLRDVAKRLRAVARASDTVARVDRDEFVILQLSGVQPAGAARLAEAIIAALSSPVQLGPCDVQIGVSIGIAVVSPDVATSRELIRRADVVLYAAKAAGRGTYRFFGAEDRAPAPTTQSSATVRTLSTPDLGRSPWRPIGRSQCPVTPKRCLAMDRSVAAGPFDE